MAKQHPNKHIRQAIRYAEQHGWRILESAARAHSWGKLLCPTAGGCFMVVYSTPRNPERHARDIRRAVDTCPHAAQRAED